MTEELKTQPEGADPKDANAGGEQAGQGERTFTEAELQAVVRDRLARQRSQFADYDTLKDAAAHWEEHRKAQMTELEKAQARITELERVSAKAQEQITETLIRSAFLAEAVKLGATHPEDAYLLAKLDGVNLDESGKVVGVTEAVAALAEAGRLVMVGKAPPPNLDGGAGSGGRIGDRGSIQRAVRDLTPAERHIAEKMHLTAEEYAESKLEIAKATM